MTFNVSDNEPNGTQLGTVITDPRVRAWIYGTFVVLLTLAGAATAGFAVLGQLPVALVVTNTVLAYLGVPVGGLALANTKGLK